MRRGLARRGWFAAAAIGALAASVATAGPRRPRDLVLDPGARWLFTANETSGSVSALEIASGRVLSEVPLDPMGRPVSIALAARAGEVRLAVVERFAHRLSLLRFDGDSLRRHGEVPLGRLPVDVVFRPDGVRALVACASRGELWEIDTHTLTLRRRMPAVEGAKEIALFSRPGSDASREDTRELAAVAGRTEVAILDLEDGRLISRREIEDRVSNIEPLNPGELAIAADRLFIAHQVQGTRVEVDRENISWGLFLANRVSGIALEPDSAAFSPPRTQELEDWIYPLDERHRANGDPSSIALVPLDDRRRRADPARRNLLLVAASGTGRLLFIDLILHWPFPPEPLFALQPVEDLEVGARPVAVRVSPDSKRAYVACALDDEVVEVDIERRSILRRLSLGARPEPDARELGARIFYDATRSTNGWYSCHTCHPDGETRGHTFDTLADGGGLSKKAPSLLGVAESGPWSWRGGFETLEAQVAASLEKTMAVERPPAKDDVARLVAFLGSLRDPDAAPSAGDEPAAIEAEALDRGRVVFERSGCSKCHRGEALTSSGTHDVGVFDAYDGVREYNAPSLRGVRDGGRWLHDGRARTLRAVFSEHNVEQRHGRADELNDDELADLVTYLESL